MPAWSRPNASFTHSYGPPSWVKALPTSDMTRAYGRTKATASAISQVKPSPPLLATIPSVSRPTNAQIVKNTMSKRRIDLISLLFSCSASSVVRSTACVPATAPASMSAPFEGSVELRHHVLDLGVVLQGVGREVLAVAGLLVAAVRHLRDERDVVVDPDRPELELARRRQRPPDVTRPDRRGEAVADVVRPRDRLVVAREPLHGDDRAEDLALDDPRVLPDVGDHCRFDGEAAVTVRAAAGQDRRLRALGPFQEAEHPVLLRLGDHRPHLDLVALRRVADLQRLDGRDQLLEQPVVDPRRRHHPRGSSAVLARVPVAGDLDPLDRKSTRLNSS